jgi:hypothetical protein
MSMPEHGAAFAASQRFAPSRKTSPKRRRVSRDATASLSTKRRKPFRHRAAVHRRAASACR